MPKMFRGAALWLGLVCFNLNLPFVQAQGTAFTYQGRLNSGGAPAGGNYDLVFTLYATNTAGTAVAGPVTNAAVEVTNGLFTTFVDFGPGVFTGTNYWVALAVSPNGANAFSPLTPRQPVTPTPYALFAADATTAASAGAVAAANVTGTLGLAHLPAAVVTNGAAGVNLAGAFTGNGAGLTNLPAWQLNGNPGTTNGNYLGTPDNQPLEFRVAGARAGLITPSNGLPNIILGPAQNVISNTTAATSILGGSGNSVQAGSSYSVIGGGSGNVIQAVDDHSVIGGGIDNSIQAGANLSVLGGGQHNIIGASAFASIIGGGIGNEIFSGASYCFIGGGTANGIQANAYESTLGGGNGNSIGSGSVGSFIGSGIDNSIQANDIYAVLVGGNQNIIWTGATFSLLGGGQFNNLQAGAMNSVLGGGSYNTILSSNSFLGSGQQNTISNNATYSVLAGGFQNGVGGSYATVPGGSNNLANGANSFAAGSDAQATNPGAFVWSDAEGTPFASANANSFNVRANGGVRLVTGGAGLTLDGQPVLAGNNGSALTNLNAAQLATGTVPSARLPAAVVTNGESAVGLNNLFANQNLFVSGALWLPEPPVILSGGSVLLTVDTNANSFFGIGAGYASPGTPGSYNTGIGGSALGANTTGSNNVALGFGALQFTTNANNVVAVGYQALQNENTGANFPSGNTGLGYEALQADKTGLYNTAVGYFALGETTSGSGNVAVGIDALAGNTTGFNNIAIGISAGTSLPAGSSNNIDIGSPGASGDGSVIRIGTTQTATYLAGSVNCAALTSGVLISGPITSGPITSSGFISASGPILCDSVIASGAINCGSLTSGPSTCTVLTITGGSDLAEPFAISPADQPVAEGAVVVIDEANPGRLKLTDRPYDARVAGVVSGANGVHPGIQMHQQGLLEGGRNVALSGRVYVQADTSNGAIVPGDLLTTSGLPGRAMKVTDHARAAGAILGKAMTPLSAGNGMVLVLVTLQ